MITVSTSSHENKTIVSPVLSDNSLIEMAKLDAPLCCGWILGAMSQCKRWSKFPNSVFVETDAALESLQVHLPGFTAAQLEHLKGLPCLTSQGQFIIASLPGYVDHGQERIAQLERLMVGWFTFSYFDSKKMVANAEAIQAHLIKSIKPASSLN